MLLFVCVSSSTHCALTRPCIPAASGARRWTSWTRWWSAASCRSSALGTGCSSPTWGRAAWRSSAVCPAPASCRSTTPSPPRTGECGLTWPIREMKSKTFRDNWWSCRLLLSGTRCKRRVWYWIVPWRTSPCSSTVRNSSPTPLRPVSYSHLCFYRVRREVSMVFGINEAKCGEHSSHLGKCIVLFFLPELNYFFF